MAKKRVYELAKELNVDNNKIIDLLAEEGIVVNSILKTIDDNVIDLIKSKVSNTSSIKSSSESLTVKEKEENSKEGSSSDKSKTGISMSIKERMAQKSQNLRDKFSSRKGLKEKLAMRVKDETPEKEEVVSQELDQVQEETAQQQSLPQKVFSRDVQKKKIKEIGDTPKVIEKKKDNDSVSQNISQNGNETTEQNQTGKSEDKKENTSTNANKDDNRGNRKKGKKDREKTFKKRDREIEEEERKLAKAAITKKKKKDKSKKDEDDEEVLSKEIDIYDGMTVKEIADKMRMKETEIIKELFMKGTMVTVNQALEKDLIEKIILDHGFEVKKAVSKEDEILERKLEEMSQDEGLLELRPPVVTIMGHVDHGKTSLLDAIRKAKVTEGEAGGITQHIGAYQVELQERLITFLDTPGHEAFTALRSRGAKSTDIAVLVVAADDGVMPQTIEAINHAKAAAVPIIVAINKMDKPDATPDRVKQQLAEHDLVAEDWGGSTVTVPVSAKTKEGLDDLLEMILLTADLQELKANPNKKAQGVIIESKLDKGKGPVATVLIQGGTLRVGDAFVVGTVSGKVRAMFDHLGKNVKEALPSTPVQVIGYSSVPVAGELFSVVDSDKEAKSIAEKAFLQERERSLSPVRALNLEALSEQIEEGKLKELNVVIKGDAQGSIEALNHSLSKLSFDEVKLRIIHSAVGDVSETDVSLASASSAVIVAFNVKVDTKAKDAAEKEKVDVREYQIIYRVIEDIQMALEGLLEPEMEEVLTGKAEVRAIFTVGKTNVIAGSYVTEGKIVRNSTVRLFRGSKMLHEGRMDSLKRFKDDVKEVATGFECGISLEKYNDIQEGDIVETYVMQVKS